MRWSIDFDAWSPPDIYPILCNSPLSCSKTRSRFESHGSLNEVLLLLGHSSRSCDAQSRSGVVYGRTGVMDRDTIRALLDQDILVGIMNDFHLISLRNYLGSLASQQRSFNPSRPYRHHSFRC